MEHHLWNPIKHQSNYLFHDDEPSNRNLLKNLHVDLRLQVSQDLLEHCIVSSTFKKDIVLDCFAGSGSSAIAALKNDRLSISIELEEKWVKSIKSRLTKLNTESDLANLNGSQIMKLTGDKGVDVELDRQMIDQTSRQSPKKWTGKLCKKDSGASQSN